MPLHPDVMKRLHNLRKPKVINGYENYQSFVSIIISPEDVEHDNKNSFANDASEARSKIISLLGSKCKTCGCKEFNVLQIDHIKGGGIKDKAKWNSPLNYYLHIIYLIEQNVNFDYQLLCANCNWQKRHDNNEQPYIGSKGFGKPRLHKHVILKDNEIRPKEITWKDSIDIELERMEIKSSGDYFHKKEDIE